MNYINARRSRRAAASVVSIWEIALKIERRRLDFDGTSEDWHDAVMKLPFLTFLPLTAEIALRSQTEFRDFPHRDPADRFILATAMTHGLRLLTTDQKLQVHPAAVDLQFERQD